MTWESFRTTVIKALPALGGVASLVWLFYALVPQGGVAATVGWQALAKLGVAVVISFAVVAMLRFALGPFADKPAAAPRPLPSNDTVRDRLAPVVLAIGGAAIGALAFGLIVAFAVLARDNAELSRKVDSLLMGVFTAVLPVFSTWVGTVIAFYFTNESFRQAAQTAREAAQALGSGERVTDRMIPYAKIAKIEEERALARTIVMERAMKLFNDNTTRVIVFDKTKQPVFILRRKSPPMPKTWDPQDPATFAGKTIDEYLKENDGKNAADAASFGFIAENATVELARAEMIKSGGEDLFITASGQKTEEVIGWLPKDRLK